SASYFECMETGRGTHAASRWGQVPEVDRLGLCRDQETDRQRIDREIKEWQEEQRRQRDEAARDKKPADALTAPPGQQAKPGESASAPVGPADGAPPCLR